MMLSANWEISHVDTYLKIDEVAERLRLCRASIYNLVARGELPTPTKFGRSARWSLARLEAAERALTAQAEAR